MTSNLFSRLLPQSTAPSIYDTLRQAAEQSDDSDVEERAALVHDDRSEDTPPRRYGKRRERDDGAVNVDTVPFRDASPLDLRSPASRPSQGASRSPEWRRNRTKATEEDEANDDVPLSLLVEDESPEASPAGFKRLPPRPSDEPDYIPVEGRPGSGQTNWSNDPVQQRMRDQSIRPAYAGRPFAGNPLLLADEREKAMWRWTNVTDLDGFLKNVYEYYLGKGIYSIILARLIHLLTEAFVVGFGLFLTTCIDYSNIPGSKTMADIIVPKCTQRMSGFKYTAVCFASFLWFWQLFLLVASVPRLWQMHNFYKYLLDIPESDMQTVSWQQVVGRLMTLRDLNANTANDSHRTRRFLGTQSKQRMDAHDIANRLMRRENYLIALMNKDVLDLKLQIPYFGSYSVFSKSVEWYLNFTILDFVFDHQGQVNPLFLGSAQRTMLSQGLQRRFRSTAVFNMICAPFIVLYMTLLYFFKYFQEYQKNPGRLGAKQYSPLAEWKLREFNELPHLLERRLKMSYNIATMYLNHWPKDKMVQVARFVGLVAGALASVLVLASLWDPELFLGFEITHDRTVLFYTGVLAAIWTAARNVEQDETETVLPEEAMEVICSFTHYKPDHWKDKLHSDEVRKEFAGLYQVKLIIFLEELLSIVLFPYILWFNLPACSNRIVDFFREFTIHVDGLGYVCSFAVFDFNKGGRNVAQAGRPGPSNQNRTGDARDEYFATKDNKMMSSYMHFMDAYVHDPSGRKPMAQLAHFHHVNRNRQFHPPPAYPGMSMAGSHAAAADAGPAPAERRPTAAASRADLAGARSARTPRFAASSAVAASPAASMLLDPVHQPATAASTFRPGRSAMQSQLRKSRTAPVARDDIIGEEEEDEDDNNATAARNALPPDVAAAHAPADSHASSSAQDDSQLGGSWKTTRAGNVEDDELDFDDGHDAANIAGEEGGVLGLIAQFGKAQAKGAVQI